MTTIISLVDHLQSVMREQGISHMSLFDDGSVYLSTGSIFARTQVKGNGRDIREALAALETAKGEYELLETLY